ncbi:MAG: hypothetical protein DRP94_05555 [Candidatus Latescibacterota bacterium]|nr:MAG: hypothetical protein DRP94_05555 [Candidatus Latescibacterota bacterium]
MKLCNGIVGAILVAMATSARAQTRTVVFNEIMWMGSSASGYDKWIELRNTTGQEVDISGWLITKLSGGEETEMLTLPDNSVLGPYEVFLMARYSADDTNSVLGVQPDLISSKVSFPKSNLQLKLYSIQGSDTTLIDVAGDGGSPPAGDEDEYRSMVRRYHSDPDSFPKAEDGTLESSWFTAVYRAGWDSGATEKGTPGHLEPALLRVVPSGDTVVFRDTFTVSVRVEDVINLFSGNFSLKFDSTAVELVEVDTTSQREFLGESSVMLDTTFGDSLNVGVTKLGGGGALGTGNLAVLTFRAVGGDMSSSPLKLSDVKLRSAAGLGSILVEPVDDTVTVVTLKVLSKSPRDGATNVIASAPIRARFERSPAVAVTEGTFRIPGMSGTVTYCPSAQRAVLSPSQLLSGDTQYTAVLDKSLGMEGDYTWSFTTSVVGDIFDLDDPTDQDPEDDYVGDGLVDGDDLAVIGFFWGTTSSSENWCPLPDLNKDGMVDHSDLRILAKHYGERSSHSPKRGFIPLVLVSGEGEFRVEAREVEDLYAFHFALTYDDKALELTEVEDGGFLGGPGEAAFVVRKFPGKVVVGGTRLGRIGGVSGSGCLARFKFRPRSGEFPEPVVSEALLLGPDLSPSGWKGEIEVPDLPELGVLSNPLFPPGRILLMLPRACSLKLDVYDALGRRVRRLAEGKMSAGRHVLDWDGRDELGREVGDGVYTLLLMTPGRRIARKFVLLR